LEKKIMTIDVNVILQNDGGPFSSTEVIAALSHIERLSRDAAVYAIGRIASDLELPPTIQDAAFWRIYTEPNGLFWIDSIELGSIDIKGKIMTAAITAILTATVGASINEGWKQTKSHQHIVAALPKIENYIIESFQSLMDRERPSTDRNITIDRVAVIRDERAQRIKISIRIRR
tara:strand:- start:80 stop:604 length:525 start_codon:yes stop_codon:yes gene_type:complete